MVSTKTPCAKNNHSPPLVSQLTKTVARLVAVMAASAKREKELKNSA
jgi:hypothetical protein